MLTHHVMGSPKTRMPIAMAVRGSKAPSVATLVLSMFFIAMTRVTLLIVVGMKPNNNR